MRQKLSIKCLLSFIFGGIAVFSYSPFDYWPLAFISFVGLLLFINQQTAKQTALVAFSWGFGYFLSGVHWVYISIKQYGDVPTILSIGILFLLVAYLALYPMIFALLLRLLRKHCQPYSFKQFIILAPLFWQLTEYIRGTLLNGFAWLIFGYSQLESPLGGLFPILGINGVTLTFTICSGIFAYVYYRIVINWQHYNMCGKWHIYSAICTIIVIFTASFWFKTIHWTQIDSTRQANISLVQGNIPQSIRWSREQLNTTRQTYSDLTQQHIKTSDIVIWPEAAITDLEINQQSYLISLDELAIANNTAVAVGIIDLVRQADQTQIYNSLIVLGDTQPYQYPTTNRYLKHHLVPFGEYTPLESLLKPIASILNIPMSSMSSGPTIQKPLVMKGFRFSTVICYEVVLSDLILQNFDGNTDFLLTVSNDAWFGDSIGPWQHLQMARARALEFGRTLLRSTNNGITAVITPQGLISNQIPQFETTTLTTTLNPSIGLTPYARWGNYLYYILLLALIIILFIGKKR